MEMILQLLIAAFVPVVLTIIFYLLIEKTKFANCSKATQQIIIGIAFGLAAVLATEKGVDVGGATANARDAAPLCAGLIFGGPAGIIAGVIGGVERFFATYWGAGAYSQIACSISTIIAGFFAAILRKKLFDNKPPMPFFGFAIAIIMEAFHLSLLFVTHIEDSTTAFGIIKIVTIPMILVNAVAVLLSIFIITLLSGIRSAKEKSTILTISQKVQKQMLVCVIFAYLLTTVFVYFLQTSSASKEMNNLLSQNIVDVKQEIDDRCDADILEVTRKIAKVIDSGDYESLEKLAKIYDVTEINIVSNTGVILDSTYNRFIGYDMTNEDQGINFVSQMEWANEYVAPLQTIAFDIKNTDFARKYAGVSLAASGFVQVGYDSEKFHTDIYNQIKDIAYNRHVGEDGYVLIANKSTIVSSTDNAQTKYLFEYGISGIQEKQTNTRYTASVNGVESYWMYDTVEEYYIITVIPKESGFFFRDLATYVNSFMEILVFATLFILIYLLIKKLVVDNIRKVNNDLEKIIGGDLSVQVDVRSSFEFASLSDDINSTVGTLKDYIEQAKSRIDAELEYAKNIQASSLPSHFPPYPTFSEFDIYATMNAAKEVGGDFYDFYMLNDRYLAFTVADVSGKGIPGALFMMRSKTMLKNLAEAGYTIDEILTKANTKLNEGNEAGMFVTCWMGILDVTNGHVTYSNAGHNPPLLAIENKKFEYLRCKPGFVLAGLDGVKYKPFELDLKPGDRIYLYTDGVTEATNAEKQLYGEDRLVNFLNKNYNLKATDMLPALKKDIDEFVGEAEQFDDITMVMLDYYGPNNQMVEKQFEADDKELDNAFEFLETELEKHDVSMKTITQIKLAFEEAFVNVAHYAYSPETKGNIKVEIGIVNDIATFKITDSGKAFDPIKAKDPDITLSAEERNIGGLGILMVKKLMDSVRYEYKDSQNILTMIKRI